MIEWTGKKKRVQYRNTLPPESNIKDALIDNVNAKKINVEKE